MYVTGRKRKENVEDEWLSLLNMSTVKEISG